VLRRRLYLPQNLSGCRAGERLKRVSHRKFRCGTFPESSLEKAGNMGCAKNRQLRTDSQ